MRKLIVILLVLLLTACGHEKENKQEYNDNYNCRRFAHGEDLPGKIF